MILNEYRNHKRKVEKIDDENYTKKVKKEVNLKVISYNFFKCLQLTFFESNLSDLFVCLLQISSCFKYG